MRTLASIAIVFPFLVVWTYLLYRIDRRRPDKRSGPVILLMVAAGGLSIIPATLTYWVNPLGLAYWYGPIAYNIAVVGINEEMVKFAVFILTARVLKSIREPQDGIVQGAAVGMGFAAVENVLYGILYGPKVALIRSMLIGFHALAGALWGFAWSGAVYENLGSRRPRIYRLALLGFIPVAVLHGLYNTLANTAMELDLLLLLLGLFEAVLLFIALKGYRWMQQRSPYHRFPYRDAHRAMEIIRRGLLANPRSITLNRRMSMYAIAAANYREAIRRIDTCLRRSTSRQRSARERLLLGIAVLGAGSDDHGASLLREAAADLTEPELAAMETEIEKMITEPELARRVYRLLNPPYRGIDQWEARRKALGRPAHRYGSSPPREAS